MDILPLLGRNLKDDEVTEILDSLKATVIYDFDRSHEGLPDAYWAALHEAGIQLKFDETQTLDTVFLYIQSSEGFAPFATEDSDIQVFASVAEANAFGETQHLKVAKGRADFLGRVSDWIWLGFEDYSIHYEFRSGGLALITITRLAH